MNDELPDADDDDVWFELNEPTPRTYMRRARAFAAAAEQLASGPGLPHSSPIVVMAYHAAELALKAVLLEQGMTANKIQRKYGHDLGRMLRRSRIDWKPVDVEARGMEAALTSLRYVQERGLSKCGRERDVRHLLDQGSAMHIMRYVMEQCARRLHLPTE